MEPRNMVAVQLKTLMAEGTATSIAQQREIQAGVHRHAGDEHVMTPHQEADDRDSDAGSGDEGISEDALCARSRSPVR